MSPATPSTRSNPVEKTLNPPAPGIVQRAARMVDNFFKDVGQSVVEGLRELKEIFSSITERAVEILGTLKGGVLFIGGVSYQIIDSSLFNVISLKLNLLGHDINKIDSLPFQVGRGVGNSTVQALALLAIVKGTGTAAKGTASAVSITGVCVASLAGGGTMLVPCTVSVGAAGITAAVGAITATYGGIVYSIANQNQRDIAEAIKKAGTAEKAGKEAAEEVVKFKSPPYESLKPTDAKLKNIVNDLYKGYGSPKQIGSGSAADAIRNELVTGQPTEGVFHSEKGRQYIKALENWLSKNPNANENDIKIAKILLQDLKDALRGK